ncbi:ABC transporter ATP-binding protein [Marinicrinis lubricantis]|uniref:ABC transporter ATP-binding protein n=1 Tax=Marinicrinis lubricantis TaxID=2086470 RepID=A0ABW1IQU7_9BACL
MGSALRKLFFINDRKLVVLRTLRKMTPFIVKAAPYSLFSLLCLQLAAAAMPVVQLFLTKTLIEHVTFLLNEGHGISRVYEVLALQTGVYLVGKSLDYIERVMTYRVQQKLKYQVEQTFIEKVTRLPLIYFDQSGFHDQMQRASVGMDLRGFHLFSLMIGLLKNGISLLAMIGTLFLFHWTLSLALLLMMLPKMLVNMKTGHARYQQMQMQTPASRKMQYLFHLLQSREAAKEIRLFRLTDYLTKRWSHLFWQTHDEKYKLERKNGFYLMLTHYGDVLFHAAIIAWLVWIGSQHQLTIGDYVALTQALISIQPMIHTIGENIALMYEEALFIDELFTYLELPEEHHAQQTEAFPVPLKKGIRVQQLSFTYPGQEQETIKDISFTVRPGETIAIVGENGSGKSTLIKCLLGLYQTGPGHIFYDDVDIAHIDISSLRSHVSAVFQDYMSYYLTVRENIGFGSIDRMGLDADIEAAAGKAGIDDMVDRFEQKYETELGPVFHGGQELSGGQWQKIAIGRAYMRSAPVMVLDEPTAALDPYAEEEIYNRFAELAEGSTTFMVSHRLGSCTMADRILLLKDGSLIEEGTHEELLARNGEYASMFRLQAKWYRSEAKV